MKVGLFVDDRPFLGTLSTKKGLFVDDKQSIEALST